MNTILNYMLLTKKDLILLALEKKIIKNLSSYLIYHVIKFFLINSNDMVLGIAGTKPIIKVNLCQSYELKVKTSYLNTLDQCLLVTLENLIFFFKKCRIRIDYLKVLKKKLTVLRSPFVYKKSREQFIHERFGALVYLDLHKSNLFYTDYFINTVLTYLTTSFTSKIEFVDIQSKS